MPDKVFYQIIADELAAKKMDAVLWTKAIAIADGDSDKTQAAYIRLRFLDLKHSALSQTASPLGINSSRTKPEPLDSGPSRMRSELTKKLHAQRKSSLYSILGLQPDASDAVVAAAIADFESRDQVGSSLSMAEFKYAKETLGNSVLREQYDRTLLNSMLNDGNGQVSSYTCETADNESSWWESSKTSAIIGVLFLALFGYLALGFFKARSGHEIQKEVIGVQRDTVGIQRDVVDVQRDAVQSASDINKLKIQADIDMRQRSLGIAEEAQRRQMDNQAQFQERQRQEQERRNAMEQERQKLQQQQAENLKVQREKQYWACINQQLSLRNATNSDAYARCAMYH